MRKIGKSPCGFRGGNLCSTALAATDAKKETGQIEFSASLYNILHLHCVSYNEASRLNHQAFLFFLPFTHLMLVDGNSSVRSPNSLAMSLSEEGTSGDWLVIMDGPMLSPALGFGPDGRSEGSNMLCMMASMSPVGVRLSRPTWVPLIIVCSKSSLS